MNKEKLIHNLENEVNLHSSHISAEYKELEMRVYKLLIDIMTNEDSANRFTDIFFKIPKKCFIDDEEELYDFITSVVNNNILDDGELHIIYDTINDKWYLDDTYDFNEYIEWMHKNYKDSLYETLNIDINKTQYASIDDYERRTYKYYNDEIRTCLGLKDFEIILKCIKDNDMSSLKNKISLNRYSGN